MTKGVYLLHYEKVHPNSSYNHHYLGYSDYIELRVDHHKNGSGSKFTQQMSLYNISFQVVKIWADKDRNYERILHNQNNLKRLCPICNPGYQGKYK